MVVIIIIIIIIATILLLQSNEVGGSYYMEKEGLHRVLQFLNQENVNIGALVTDRHRQINKWLNDNHPSIVHYYDTWHVAKSKEHFLYCILHDLFPICLK